MNDPNNPGTGCSKQYVPTWQQMLDVFINAEQKWVINQGTSKDIGGNIRKVTVEQGKQRSAIDSRYFLRTFLAFALVEARGLLLHFKGLHNHRGLLAQRQKWTKMAMKGAKDSPRQVGLGSVTL